MGGGGYSVVYIGVSYLFDFIQYMNTGNGETYVTFSTFGLWNLTENEML